MNKRRRLRRSIQPAVPNDILERLAQAVEQIANTSERIAEAAQRIEDAVERQPQTNKPLSAESLYPDRKEAEQAISRMPGTGTKCKQKENPCDFVGATASRVTYSEQDNASTDSQPIEATSGSQSTALPTEVSKRVHRDTIPITVRLKEDCTHEIDTAEWDTYHTQFKNDPNARVNPSWVAFFRGCLEASELIKQRRAACAACTALWREEDTVGTLNGIHPGLLLQRDFLGRPGVDVGYIGHLLDLSSAKTKRFLAGETSITPIITEKLAARFDLPTEWWQNLQRNYDDVAMIPPKQ